MYLLQENKLNNSILNKLSIKINKIIKYKTNTSYIKKKLMIKESRMKGSKA